jgi:PAS domain S-box-containing protein
VITDYALRWTDGLTVLRAVKDRWPATPVIMYTGTGNEEVAVDGMKLGLDDYVVKSPQHLRRLGSSVERALRHAGDQRALVVAKEALVETEARFRALVENSSDFEIVLTADGTISYGSPSVGADLGYEQTELDGMSALDLIHPDDVLRVQRLLQQLVAEPEYAVTLAARFRRRRGEWRSWEGVATNRLEEPSITGLLVNAHDVTARVQAEEQGREAEHRYQGVFKNVPIGLYRSTPDGRHVDANPAMVQILGFDGVQSFLESRAEDLYVDPEDQLRWREVLERDGVVRGFEERLRRRDGRVIWVRDSATAVRDESGRIVMYDGNIEDITERVEAEHELRMHTRRQVAVAELGRAALTDGPLSATLEAACRIVSDTLHVEFADFVELLPDEACFLIRASVGWPDDVAAIKKFAAAGSPASLVMESRRTIAVADIQTDLPTPAPTELTAAGVVGSVWVPIEARDRLFGVLCVHCRERRTFSPDEIMFLDAVANILGDVIRRKETEDDLRKTLRRLHELSEERQRLLGRLVAAQEEERQRLAGDIHDDPIQVMAAAAVRLDMVERAALGTAAQSSLERTAETVQLAINRLRHLVFELRPPALDREGLAVAIRQYTARLAEAGEIEIGLQDDLDREPSREIRTAAYRIVQEALTNVRKHAGATRVQINLASRDEGIATVVTDDGVGFRADGELARQRPGHIGLQSMRERAEALGGWWRIESRPQGGTTMEFWLPDGVDGTGPQDD